MGCAILSCVGGIDRTRHGVEKCQGSTRGERPATAAVGQRASFFGPGASDRRNDHGPRRDATNAGDGERAKATDGARDLLEGKSAGVPDGESPRALGPRKDV